MSKRKKQKKKREQLKKYPRCWKTKKISYPDETMARRGLAATWRHRPEVEIADMNVFECYYCKKFHLGHKSKYKEYLKKHEAVCAE